MLIIRYCFRYEKPNAVRDTVSVQKEILDALIRLVPSTYILVVYKFIL